MKISQGGFMAGVAGAAVRPTGAHAQQPGVARTSACLRMSRKRFGEQGGHAWSLRGNCDAVMDSREPASSSTITASGNDDLARKFGWPISYTNKTLFLSWYNHGASLLRMVVDSLISGLPQTLSTSALLEPGQTRRERNVLACLKMPWATNCFAKPCFFCHPFVPSCAKISYSLPSLFVRRAAWALGLHLHSRLSIRPRSSFDQAVSADRRRRQPNASVTPGDVHCSDDRKRAGQSLIFYGEGSLGAGSQRGDADHPSRPNRDTPVVRYRIPRWPRLVPRSRVGPQRARRAFQRAVSRRFSTTFHFGDHRRWGRDSAEGHANEIRAGASPYSISAPPPPPRGKKKTPPIISQNPAEDFVQLRLKRRAFPDANSRINSRAAEARIRRAVLVP